MADRALLCDVSGWQGTIDFGALAGATATLNGVPVGQMEGTIIKATEGTHFVDPYFAMNWAGAKMSGLARGAYHFMRADRNGPETEADYFLSVVGPVLEAGDVLALDCEDSPGSPQPHDLLAWVSTWLARVTAAVGFMPMIYSTRGYLGPHNLTGNATLADHGLWLASWFDTVNRPFPSPPPDWVVTALWQFSDHGSVAGIQGPVDLDYMNGDINTFRAYGKPPPAAAPDRAPLDNFYRAWQEGRAAFSAPPDLADWDAMMPHFDAIKQRNGIQP